MTVLVKLKRCRYVNLPVPEYQTKGAAAFDLRAALLESLTIKPQERALIPTGWSMTTPIGYEGQVRPRSGLALKQGLTVLNSPGTIDSDYTGEVGVILFNSGKEDVVVNPLDRIAQMVITPVTQASFEVVSELEDTDRGAGGFGSTGV